MWRFSGQYRPRPQSAGHSCAPWHLRRALCGPQLCLCLLNRRPTPPVPQTGSHLRRLAARPLRPHPSALPYPTVPAAADADPVLSSGGPCPRLSSPRPSLPRWPSSTAGRVPATSCSSAPPCPSPTPCVPYACPRHSPSLADSSSPPRLQPVALLCPSTLYSPCAWRRIVSPT